MKQTITQHCGVYSAAHINDGDSGYLPEALTTNTTFLVSCQDAIDAIPEHHSPNVQQNKIHRPNHQPPQPNSLGKHRQLTINTPGGLTRRPPNPNPTGTKRAGNTRPRQPPHPPFWSFAMWRSPDRCNPRAAPAPANRAFPPSIA